MSGFIALLIGSFGLCALGLLFYWMADWVYRFLVRTPDMLE